MCQVSFISADFWCFKLRLPKIVCELKSSSSEMLASYGETSISDVDESFSFAIAKNSEWDSLTNDTRDNR